ncbi:hypothetical protein [Chitinophaga qingshengii]|uniref:Uncharacterized protein n=1 Tax=Chitinophaga qingshengii TaxID=1569794 RepID=A0ABR7TIE5_9BACT|nr:hypothetical protein [Chitinophaga qingshengii]MBC9930214.1 hypothetical protein [Chitinophaga qingshengii]
MSADNQTPEKNIVRLTGRLVLRTFGQRSKSEHLGVYLVCDQKEYLIRPAGANPFMNNPLMKLAGKTITAEGYIVDYVFLARSWAEEDSSPDTTI